LKRLMKVLSMDPTIGVKQARWIKLMIEEMDSAFLDAFFAFQDHQSYDEYKQTLLELIESREGEVEEAGDDYSQYEMEGDEEEEQEGDEGEEEEQEEGDDDDEDSERTLEFAAEVVSSLSKGKSLDEWEATQLLKMVKARNPTILNAFRQLQTSNEPQLYQTLMRTLARGKIDDDDNDEDEDQEDDEQDYEEEEETEEEETFSGFDLEEHQALFNNVVSRLYERKTITAKQAMDLKGMFEGGQNIIVSVMKAYDTDQNVEELEETLALIALRHS